MADNHKPSWGEAFSVYTKPQVLAMLFLGFSAGLPLLLVFGTLSAWLARLEIAKTEIGYFSWVGITYSLKFLWAPVIDRLPPPWLARRLGKRRGWMLVAQLGIISGLLAISLTDPAGNLTSVALLALLVAFSSATQDIVIDAYRIESAADELQGAMAANYQLGYRLGMITAGAGAFYVAGTVSWPTAYQVMALCMVIGVITAFVITEPSHQPPPQLSREMGVGERRQVAWNFAGIAALFATVSLSVIFISQNNFARSVFTLVLLLALTLLVLARAAYLGRARTAVAWFYPAVIMPFSDFFRRQGWFSLVILAFIAMYRFSDITLGIMANPFYIDLGFNEVQIAEVTKVYGLVMTILGAYAGGLLVTHSGIRGPLLLGACLVAATNLLFAWLAETGPDIVALTLTVSADNFSGGLAGSALIAYASSLTNRTFSASQYAVFSSLFTLLGKFIGGFSGIVVDGYGYETFFVVAAILGIPAIALTLVLLPRIPGKAQLQASMQ